MRRGLAKKLEIFLGVIDRKARMSHLLTDIDYGRVAIFLARCVIPSDYELYHPKQLIIENENY